MLKCNHSWGGHVCDRQARGIVAYVCRHDEGRPRIRVEISCTTFLAYHFHHGGIAVLTAYGMDTSDRDIVKAKLLRERSIFLEAVAAVLPKGDQHAAMQEEATLAYDRLVADFDKWVIEFRNGSFLGDSEADHGCALEEAQRFGSMEEADAFMRQHPWTYHNGGMAIPVVRQV